MFNYISGKRLVKYKCWEWLILINSTNSYNSGGLYNVGRGDIAGMKLPFVYYNPYILI